MNGVRARQKKHSFLRKIEEESPDWICLQESRVDWNSFLRQSDVRATLERNGYRYIAHATSAANVGYAGVTIISKFKWNEWGTGVLDGDLDLEGRVVFVKYDNFTLLNVYSPNSGSDVSLTTLDKRLRFEKKLQHLCCKLVEGGQPLFIVGDLNVVKDNNGVWGPEGLLGSKWTNHPACTKNERDALAHLMTSLNLSSVGDLTGFKQWTFFHRPRNRLENRGMVLDYALCTKEFFDSYVTGFQHCSNPYRI